MSGLCRNHSTFFSLSPIVEYLGYQKGLTLFCSEGGWGGHRARGAAHGMGKGRTGAWLGPTAQCHFLSGPLSRFQTFERSHRAGREGHPPPRPIPPLPLPLPPPPPPPLSSRLRVPGGSSVPAAAGGTICAAQVCPAPCPTWGQRTLGRLWPPRARRAAAPGLPSACAGPPGAARGGAAGTRPRLAAFKRCQGLIDEKWPRAGANLSREATGWRAGARGGAAA